jgi:hypothetical protein
MRKDMAKVVTESPRRGHSNRSSKWGRRLTKDEYALDDHGARVAHPSRVTDSTAGTRRNSPTRLDRCAAISANRSADRGTKSGPRSEVLGRSALGTARLDAIATTLVPGSFTPQTAGRLAAQLLKWVATETIIMEEKSLFPMAYHGRRKASLASLAPLLL